MTNNSRFYNLRHEKNRHVAGIAYVPVRYRKTRHTGFHQKRKAR